MSRHDFSVDLDYVQLPDKPDGQKTAVLRVKPKNRKGASYLFNLEKAWIVREKYEMFQCCMEICEVLYGMVDQRRMAHIAMAIEDKIDDLVKSKPAPELEKIFFGEGKMEINGANHYFPLVREV
jgi:hypothetical protein